jgi:2-C-methyl-D-erythritol 2,4-cyclodiphosphate synthase
MRVGIGYDIHPVKKERRLILGGVEVASEFGLAGWSDGDVVIHAIIDSLLGAAALGDIGIFFPSTAEYKDVQSTILLQRVKEAIAHEGYKVGNIDVAICAQSPSLSPFFDQMKEEIGKVLDISRQKIGIKATRPEGVGSLGRGEGICVYAVAILEERNEGFQHPFR